MEPITITITSVCCKLVSWTYKMIREEEYKSCCENYKESIQIANTHLIKLRKAESKLRIRMKLSIQTLKHKIDEAYTILDDDNYLNKGANFCRNNLHKLSGILNRAVRFPDTGGIDKVSMAALLGAGSIEAAQLVDYYAFSGETFLNGVTISDLSKSLGISDIPDAYSFIGDTPAVDILSFGLVTFSAVRVITNLSKAAEYKDGADSIKEATGKLNKFTNEWRQLQPKIVEETNSVLDKELEIYKWCLIAKVANKRYANFPQRVKKYIKANLDHAASNWWEINNTNIRYIEE